MAKQDVFGEYEEALMAAVSLTVNGKPRYC